MIDSYVNFQALSNLAHSKRIKDYVFNKFYYAEESTSLLCVEITSKHKKETIEMTMHISPKLPLKELVVMIVNYNEVVVFGRDQAKVCI